MTKTQIKKALKKHKNIKAAAEELEVPRTTLSDKVHNDDELKQLWVSLKNRVGRKKGKIVSKEHTVRKEFSSADDYIKKIGENPDDYEVDTIDFTGGTPADINKLILKKKDENLESLKTRAFEPVIYKPRKIIRSQQNREHDLWVIKADHHAGPGLDPELHETSLTAMKDIRPSHYGDIGDGSDFNSLSRFPKNDMRWFSDFNQDLMSTRSILSDNRSVLDDNVEGHYIFGNHCFRYIKWLLNDAPPGMADVEEFQLENLLRLEEFGFQLAKSETGPSYPYGEIEIIKDVLAATHGDRCRKGGGNSVRALVEQEGKSYLMGHVHDYGSTSVRIGKKIHYGFEVASMAKHDLGYARNPDHAQGFATVVARPNGTFMVEHAKWDADLKLLTWRDKQWKYQGQ